jgi:hypothetical protein
LLQANKEVVHHPQVKRQVRLVFSLLQRVSKRFREAGTCNEETVVDEEDPLASFVDDLVQNDLIEVNVDDDREIREATDSPFPGEKESSEASSSGVIDHTEPGPPVAPEADHLATEESEPVKTESRNWEYITFGGLWSSLLPLCGPDIHENDDLNVDKADPAGSPSVTAPPPLNEVVVERSNDDEPSSSSPVERRDDGELARSSAYGLDDSLRAREERVELEVMPLLPSSRAEKEEGEDDDNEDFQIKLGRGGPYDNLLRIISNLNGVQEDDISASQDFDAVGGHHDSSCRSGIDCASRTVRSTQSQE